MTTYKTVKIPRPSGLTDYHTLLRFQVFPATEDLDAEGLIEGFDFLTHKFVELRLWIPANGNEARIKEVLANHTLPNDMSDGTPAETGQDRVHFFAVMRRNVEQIRELLMTSSPARDLNEVIHLFLNQWGFSNQTEIAWYADRASAWSKAISGVGGAGPED